MKNAENVRKLLHAMNDFSLAYCALRAEIANYEHETGASVNDLPGFTGSYPFDKSFDELPINDWVAATVEGVRNVAFKVLNYKYMNTGGSCMVGIHEVWLPGENRAVYALTNEEGCNLCTVDYISNDLELEDYEECIIEYVDWGRVTGHEKYFELYRHCLNDYTRNDCRHFGYTRGIPYHLLSDELQKQVSEDYLKWCETENNCLVDTDGVRVVVNPGYESADVWDELLTAVKKFKQWHDTTAGVEQLYDKNYRLEFAGHVVELPYTADVWDAVDTMLERTIRDW